MIPAQMEALADMARSTDISPDWRDAAESALKQIERSQPDHESYPSPPPFTCYESDHEVKTPIYYGGTPLTVREVVRLLNKNNRY